jgi:predicted phosphodiesterase
VNDCKKLGVDIVLVGHTHIPFIRRINGQLLVNPGSIGQPKTGKPDACYAVWENGRVSLRTYAYPLDQTIEKIRLMPISENIQQNLITVLESGGLPPE